MYNFEIKTIPGKGRGMVATKTIAIGDVIIEEEPFVSCQFSWNKTYGYAACDHCMRPLETTLQNVRRLANDPTIEMRLLEYDPTAEWLQQITHCIQCKVAYCSEDCRREAWARYHRLGCLGAFREDDSHPINKLNDTWKKMHYPPETGTIMLIVRLLAMYIQTEKKQEFIETVQSFETSIVNAEQQIYHKMLGDNFEKQMEQLYAAFREAFNADEQFAMFTTPEAFKSLMGLIGTNSQGVATSPLAEWVRRISLLPLSEPEKQQLDDYIDQIYKKVGDFAGEFLNNEGAALYLLQSKINHSCTPNAESTFPYSNDIIVVKAIQTIQPGEEICISYLDECQLERSRYSRQKVLKENYTFVCNCPKCQLQANDPNETSEDEMDTENEDDMDD